MASAKGRLKHAAAERHGSVTARRAQLTGNVQPASAISAWAVTHTGVCALVRE